MQARKVGKSEKKTVISLTCLCCILVAVLTLNKWITKYLFGKMGLVRKNKELQFGICILMVNHIQVPQKINGEGSIFIDLGGAIVNK